ncbi:VWA domain-containing protein [Cocleimonas sp. KMM 6892]|uniref:vWA domain-containing protein n=1 Tax=unclassified Cocleimonas TaxID=2639732 RepID=UPI002DBC7155|nr:MULTISPECIES: VWA domain-containing protein [unclassified Cocleimonas]MEB8432971.1 VWA domain-containing protein [Cocleimonas sp. KMM 6892]MEC4716048.1 VWA domain-containing protein [Cocleimonas sp. KMM 6895]MEC4745509.1 VWA domain-containing protein [Cocleimonas sp. KMM 6896]
MTANSFANSATPQSPICKLFFIVFFSLFSLATSVSANAEDKAIIVFDASGSMWGQLDGKTKIEIAKKTLSDVVTNWDDEKQLGLLAYGHRRKGDCSDIETLVPVGKNNKTAMISKVNKINPKGKTPISASIKMAANELKFTEDDATVILISDGKETCNADPCETAAELEKLGVNFTAHVIGFGVDKQTSEQLQCIAENTGGLYFPADSAEQLSVALKQIVVKAKVISIRAIDEKTGEVFPKIIDWKLINQDTEEVISLEGSGAGVEILLAGDETDNNSKNIVTTEKSITAGKWLVSGTSGNYSGEATVNIEDNDQKISINFNKKLPKVVINAANEAITGTELDVSWEAPKGLKGLINLQLSEDEPKYHASPLKHTKGISETTLRLPSVAGEYVLRFYDNQDRMILAEHPITLKEAEIVINAPEEVGTGTELELSWIAPREAKAKINLEAADDKPKFHRNPHLYVKNKKKEGVMRMPATAGEYVLRWYNQSDRKLVTEKPIALVESTITLNAPDQAGTGSELELSWEAPKTTEAKINLELEGDKPRFHSNPHLSVDDRKKQRIMRMPATAGNYILRWYNRSDQKVVLEKPITLVESVITINAPDQAETGTEIDLSWEAPKSTQAVINLQLADEKPKYHSRPYLNTKGKTSATMRMPAIEGDYVLRWYNISDQKIVAEHPIKLTAAAITITAPDEAGVGTEIDLSWEAPKSSRAVINLRLADEKPSYNSRPYLYTKGKTSASMRMPSEPGEYVLRWYNESDQQIVTERPIKLTPVAITITAPDEAQAGTEIDLSWEAPKTSKAVINLQLADEKPNYNSRPYLYTKGKTSATMRMPSQAGEYVLRWYNESDQQILTERPLKVTPVQITITAPDEAQAGTEIDLSWEAPKSSKAVINLQLADEKPSYNSRPYLYTKGKTSASMRMPSEAGEYVLRWYNESDQQILTERPLKVTPVEITLSADDEAIAGTEIEVAWNAPKGLDAFINVQLADEKPNYNAKNYIYTKKNSSDYLRLPSVAGDYVLRWYNKNHRTPIAERPIKLIAPDITINVPDEIKADTEIEISWEAPKGLNNPFINIQPEGEKPNYNTKKYIYTKNKQSDYMKMPAKPGVYVLRWYNHSVTKPIIEKKITVNSNE